MVSLTASDVVRAHRAFGAPAEMVAQRRAVYQAPIALLGEDVDADQDDLVLDHPMTRGHLAEVIAGQVQLDRTALHSLSTVEPVARILGFPVRLAAEQATADVLRPVLIRIAGDLSQHGAGSNPPVVMTGEHSRFDSACRRVVAGIEVAVRLVPDLAADLLQHLALVAIVRRDSAVRLGSASAREFPGVMLLPEPSSALEATEAFVHECAHLKFFDLSVTRSVFGPNQYSAPAFRPSWKSSGIPRWPLEQVFAAFHAYCCLAALHRSPECRAGDPSPTSLLPHAATRADELGTWLADQAVRFLGDDGRQLLSELSGRTTDRAADALGGSKPETVAAADGAYVRRVGGRTLLAERGQPIRLFWLREPVVGRSCGLSERHHSNE